MALPERMKFGIFLGPFHRVGENPTLAIDRDLELVQWLDYLGYDEVWVGEHHSAGWETISSPELFIAAAAALITTMILVLARAFAGPTVYDRILAVNHIGSQTVLLIAVMGFITGRPDFLDISLLYALINFVATIAVLRYVKRGRTQADKQS